MLFRSTLSPKDNAIIDDLLEKTLGGIIEMKSTPDVIFIIDTNREHIAVLEAKKLVDDQIATSREGYVEKGA